MKKFVFALILIVCLCCISCRDDFPIVGDYYVVESVELCKKSSFSTKYRIIAKSLSNDVDSKDLWSGGRVVYYTNTFYSIHDTIKLINLGSKSMDKEKNENS